MKKYITLLISLFLIGCASTNNVDSVNYNSLDNYEIVYMEKNLTKTSELALKQINSTEGFTSVTVFIYRQSDDDLKSIMVANKKKKHIEKLLFNKNVTFIYDPKKTDKNAILKVE